MRSRKIVGTFCEKTLARASEFDRRSLRWMQSGPAWLLVGCTKGEYRPRAKRCKVGLHAYKILKPTRGACRVGRKITKG
jgi:hypothetical protein